jgi:hypothetical protein
MVNLPTSKFGAGKIKIRTQNCMVELQQKNFDKKIGKILGKCVLYDGSRHIMR